jgi:beta-lactam-binding protein with PASTA domain
MKKKRFILQNVSVISVQSFLTLLMAAMLTFSGCIPTVQVTVPAVLGLTQEEASTALTEFGLTVGAVTEAFSDSVPIGAVIIQIPAADTAVQPGTSITLVISIGIQPVLVPDLSGLTQEEAESAITAASLNIGIVSEEISGDVDAGLVLAQSPAANTSIAPGSMVNFVLSLGLPEVTVPDVVGLTQAEAQAAITDANLTVGIISETSSLTIPAGEVLSQDPQAFSILLYGQPVNLVVSSGLPEQELDAPKSIKVGKFVQWGPTAKQSNLIRSTVYDSDGNIVFHRGFAENNFAWTPFQPGNYHIYVEFSDGTNTVAQGNADLNVKPRGSYVSGTDHPLVSFYTFDVPEGMRGNVEYTCTSCPPTLVARSFTTPWINGTGGEVGALLPGLRPEKNYTLQHSIFDGDTLVSQGPELNFTSGALTVTLANVDVHTPPVNPKQNALLALTLILGNKAFIVDEQATPVWYYPTPTTLARPTGNGWGVLDGSAMKVGVIDYTGQFLRDISFSAINAMMTAMALPEQLTFHHEMRPLPGNHYAILGWHELLVEDLQAPGIVDVIADMLIILNDKMEVVWTWDSSKHLDLTRTALLNDKLNNGAFGMSFQLADVANNWTHCNAVEYDPKDGNLIISSRHQSWVIKVAYEDGAGDGHVVWRLGKDGDFSIDSNIPDPWFSYQHDPNFLPDGKLAIYDNGNYRVNVNGSGNSRGQVYILDENNMTATLDFNADLGVYADALGSSALTPDGSYHFNSGRTASGFSYHDDINMNGDITGSFSTTGPLVYRSFRMKDPFDTTAN